MIRFLIFSLILLMQTVSFSQEIVESMSFKATGPCGINKTISTPTGQIVALRYRGTLEIEGEIFVSQGSTSMVLLSFDHAQQLLWSLEAGSESEDNPIDLLYDELNDLIYWTGMFWDELEIGSETFQISVGSRAIFVAAVKLENGELDWTHIVEGTAQKQVTNLAINEMGEVLVTGYFGGSLILPNEEIIQATSDSHLFAYLVNAAGDILYIKNFGGNADLRTGASVSDGQSFYIAGTIRGVGIFENDTLSARISDTDAFVMKIAPDGSNPWAKLAGGVYDKNVTGLCWAQGKLILYGYFMGQIRVSDVILIQTNGLNIDGYWVVYNQDGVGQSAETIPGSGNIFLSHFSSSNDRLMLSGTWDGNIQHPEGFDITAPFGTQQGFVIRMNSLFKIQEFIHLESNALISDVRFLSNTQGADLLQLNYNASLNLAGNLFQTDGIFEGLLLYFDVLSPVKEPRLEEVDIALYPNPTRDIVHCLPCLNGHYAVFNTKGDLVIRGNHMDQINLSFMPAGIYFIAVQGQSFMTQTYKVIKI